MIKKPKQNTFCTKNKNKTNQLQGRKSAKSSSSTKTAKPYKAAPKSAKALPAPAKQTKAGLHANKFSIPKTRVTSVRLLHSVATKTGPHYKPTVAGNKKPGNNGKENKKQSAKLNVNGVSKGKNAANAAVKAHSTGRVNISGKVGANGKAAAKVNAVSKANKKVTAVKKTNSGTKAAAKTPTVARGKPKAGKPNAETKRVFRPISKPMPTKTNRAPPFGKSAVSGITVSAAVTRKTKPANANKEVHD